MKTHFPEQITSWNHHRTAAVSEGPAAASADAQSRRMVPKRVASPCRCGWCSAHSRAPFPRAFGGGSKMRPSRGLIDNALKYRDAQASFFKSILIVFRSLSDPPGAMDLE